MKAQQRNDGFSKAPRCKRKLLHLSPRRFIALLILLFIFKPSIDGQNVVLCQKPLAQFEAYFAYRESSRQRDFAERLAGRKGSFLYLRQISANETMRALDAVLRIDRDEGISPDTKISPKKLEWYGELMYERPEVIYGKKSDQHIAGYDLASDWYLYTNSNRLKSSLLRNRKVTLDEKGNVLQMDKAAARMISTLFSKLVDEADPSVVLIESAIDVDLKLKGFGSQRPLIVRIANKNSSEWWRNESADIVSQIRTARPENTTIMFLMPENAAEAEKWGFSEELAKRFVVNGDRILRDLQVYGFHRSVVRPRSAASALTLAGSISASSDRSILIVGESTDGKSVRIPGSADVIPYSELGRAMRNTNTRILGLACNSHSMLSETPGVGVIGPIYTDQVRRVMRIVLGQREHNSHRDYIDVPYSAKSVRNSNLSDAIAVISKHMHTNVSDSPRRAVLYSFRSSMPGPPPQTPSPAGKNDSDPSGKNDSNSFGKDPTEEEKRFVLLATFGAGFIGAFSRECLRWRRLMVRKRSRFYRQPKYFVISGALVVSGSLAAVFMCARLPMHLQPPIGFLVGAGFEELVRRASRLEIWTPSVAHGSEGQSQDDLLEYLRI